MPRLRPVAAALALGAMLALAGPAAASDSYPPRPVKIIVPLGAGGPPAHFTRAVAEELGKALKNPSYSRIVPAPARLSARKWPPRPPRTAIRC